MPPYPRPADTAFFNCLPYHERIWDPDHGRARAARSLQLTNAPVSGYFSVPRTDALHLVRWTVCCYAFSPVVINTANVCAQHDTAAFIHALQAVPPGPSLMRYQNTGLVPEVNQCRYSPFPTPP